jgi:predicted TIM-barrel fold metal-dependent hydrolase
MIIDSHVHIPTPDGDGGHPLIKDAASAVQYLRDCGTRAAIFTTWRAVLCKTLDDVNAGNEAALSLSRECDGFLYPGAMVHPLFPAASLDWLARFRDKGLKWVGELLPKSDPACPFAGAEYMRLFEECAKHGHVVQLHNTPDVREVAKRFPQMPVVCAHIPSAEECRQLAALPNVWMDVSGQNGGLRMGGMETACDTMGAGRLLYGTDFSGYEPRCFVARVNVVFPSIESQSKVYHRNLRFLLSQVGSHSIG